MAVGGAEAAPSKVSGTAWLGGTNRQHQQLTMCVGCNVACNIHTSHAVLSAALVPALHSAVNKRGLRCVQVWRLSGRITRA